MTNNGLDLRPLDPERDPAWKERLVEAVMTPIRNAPHTMRAARRLPATDSRDMLSELVALTRPALAGAFAAAAVIILLSGVKVNDAARSAPASTAVAHYALAEALGMPEALASWVEAGRAPSAGELLSAVGGY